MSACRRARRAGGLTIAPEAAVGDGALGFWKALDKVFPSARHQRCWFHKISNVLNKCGATIRMRRARRSG